MNDYSGKGVLCVAEARHGKLSSCAFELLTAAKKIGAARGEPVWAAVLGDGESVKAAAAELASRGAERVFAAKHASLSEFLDEAYAAVLTGIVSKEKPRTVLLPATVFGRSLATRLAVAFKAGLAGDAIGLEVEGGKLVATRSCYAGNVIAGVSFKRAPEFATVRPMAFPRAEAGAAGKVEEWPVELPALKSEFVKFSADDSGEVDVTAADRIVSGGRGLGKPEGFEPLRRLAKLLGAAVGASRAAVDSGWIPYKHQVGLTGRSVRPRLYMACGISGQIQHLAGMNGSDTIVAINTDPDCPMMKLATYAVQGDVFKIVPALAAEIEKRRG
ncbi:MAG: electron transfer flavoprotein subunit alpha/FixB family protein [Elusimicrobiota bacterium]